MIDATDRSRADRVADPRLLVLIVAATIALAALAIIRYFQFQNSGYDTAIYGNTLWRLAHGFSDDSALTGTHLFVDHASPLLLVFVPVFRLGVDAGICLLLAAQAVSLGLVGLAVARLGRLRQLEDKLLLLVVAITVLGPSTLLISQVGFHDTTLGLGPLAMTISEGMNPRRHRFWWVWPLLAAFSRQEFAAAVVVVGVLLWRYHRRPAVTIAAIGGGTLVGAVLWIASGNPEGSMAGYHFAHLGDTPSEVVRGALRDPVAAVAPAFDRTVVSNIGIWLMPFGLVAALRAPQWLLVAFPLVALPMFGEWPAADSYWEHYWHILLVPAAIGTVLGFGLLPEWWRRIYPVLTLSLLLLTCVLWAPELGRFFDLTGDDTHQVVYQQAAADPKAALATTPETVARLSGRETVILFPRPFFCLRETFGFYEPPSSPPTMVVVDAAMEGAFDPALWGRLVHFLEAAYEPQPIGDAATIWRMTDPAAAAALYRPCQ